MKVSHSSFNMLLLLWAAFLPVSLFSQGINVEFGKNRVQYHDFVWSFFESEHFVTYFYQGGQDLGNYVVQVAEEELPHLEKLLDYKLGTRIEILVFNDVSDLNQSNVGTGVELNTNIGGHTKIIGNKVFVYFNGNHSDLRRQVKEGVAQVLLNNMIFGGSLQEVLQNAVLLNLPQWFVSGLVAYAGEHWSSEDDSRLRQGVMSGEYRNFNKLSGKDARVVGHSFWYFVEKRNGREAIPNLIYLTRINRSLENGFLFVLGFTYPEAIDAWYQFYKKRYESEADRFEVPVDTFLVKRKNFWWIGKRDLLRSRISPEGRYLAYVTDNLGLRKVYIRDRSTGKTKKILSTGFKTREILSDVAYPLIAWSPAGDRLLVIFEKRDVIRLLFYDVESGKVEFQSNLIQFQRILSLSFTDNPNEVVLSAMNRGQSDIYKMNIRSQRITKITDDFYDDLDPVYVDLGERKGILFSSNRRDTKLRREDFDTIKPENHFDIFFYNEKSTQRDELLRVSGHLSFDERQPMPLDSIYFSFLSDENGIFNRYAGYIDTIFSHFEYSFYFPDSVRSIDGRELDPQSYLEKISDTPDSVKTFRILRDTAICYPVSNYAYCILDQDKPRQRSEVLETLYLDSDYRIYLRPLPEDIGPASALKLRPSIFALEREDWAEQPIKRKKEAKKEKVNPGYFFQSEFEAKNAEVNMEKLNRQEDRKVFHASKVLPYRTKFSTDYVISQLDNSLLINPYQNFIGNGPVYQQQNLSGLITLSISDLMEDYRFTGGFRIPTNFGGSEYFIRFDDRRKLIDKSFLAYRQAKRQVYSITTPVRQHIVEARQTTSYYEARAVYPFDVTRSLRASLGLRNYRIDFLANDTFSLELLPYTEKWLSLKAEYVFDNTFKVMTNILNGMRYKVYFEMQKAFILDIDPEPNLDFAKGFLNIFGFDFRHYQKLHKQIIWANRVAGAGSFGSQKLIYYLGGVDNWLGARFNQDIDVNRSNNYAFQTIATNLRGFEQNARNGNKYLLLNSEIRVPLFTYLSNKPIRSEFLRNFQVVLFGDIGTAWEGLSPYSEDNPFNTNVFNRGPVKVKVQYFNNPIVGGYGLGARSILFGYFIRLDMAWGVDSGVIKDPILYLSMSLDF